MKRKTEDETTQTAIRLPTDLYRRLKSAGGERGMAEQIRNRLEASFAAEKTPANLATKELLDAIAFVADKTDFYYGDRHSWSNNAFVFGVFKACVDFLLVNKRPAGGASPPSDSDTVASLLFADDISPEDIARDIVGELVREKKKREIAEGKKRR
jgi:hypothetical protein